MANPASTDGEMTYAEYRDRQKNTIEPMYANLSKNQEVVEKLAAIHMKIEERELNDDWGGVDKVSASITQLITDTWYKGQRELSQQVFKDYQDSLPNYGRFLKEQEDFATATYVENALINSAQNHSYALTTAESEYTSFAKPLTGTVGQEIQRISNPRMTEDSESASSYRRDTDDSNSETNTNDEEEIIQEARTFLQRTLRIENSDRIIRRITDDVMKYNTAEPQHRVENRVRRAYDNFINQKRVRIIDSLLKDIPQNELEQASDGESLIRKLINGGKWASRNFIEGAVKRIGKYAIGITLFAVATYFSIPSPETAVELLLQ